jgi:hypothetical protein
VASDFACIAALGWVSFSSGMATAAVPSPERIAEAVAADNGAAERDQPLRLELRIQIGDRAAVATGILLTDPAGFARLELRGANGVVERHLLRGGETWVTRNGEPLDEFRFFLPPLYLLQAGDGETLRAALEGLQVLTDRVGLAECNDEDCLVLGDSRRDIPRRGPPPILGLELYEEARALRAEEEGAEAAGLTLEEWREINAAQAEGDFARPIDELAPADAAWADSSSSPDSTPGPSLSTPASASLPGNPGAMGVADSPVSSSDLGPGEVSEEALLPGESAGSGLWVDRKTYAIRGMDSKGGVRTRLGPGVIYNGVRLPSWIYIEEPGREAVRLHILEVFPAAPGPEDFVPEWLYSPEGPPSGDSAGTPIPLQSP